MKEKDFIMNDEDYRNLISQATGIMIIHLNAIMKEDHGWKNHSPMDYHLHVLFIKDVKTDILTAISLDTSDSTFKPLKDRKITELSRELAEDIARMFIDRVNTMLKIRKFDRARLFSKADSRLWDTFNHIKEETYAESLAPFADYLKTNSFSLDTKESESKGVKKYFDDKQYDWANIRFSEERFLETNK